MKTAITNVTPKKDTSKIRGKAPEPRNIVVQGLIDRGGAGGGKHKNKQDFDRGHARSPKHKGQKFEEGMMESPENKVASLNSLSSALFSWWGELEDHLVAEAIFEDGDVTVKSKDPMYFRLRIKLPNPYVESGLKMPVSYPYIEIGMNFIDLAHISVRIDVVSDNRVVRTKELSLPVLHQSVEEVASKIFSPAMETFKKAGF